MVHPLADGGGGDPRTGGVSIVDGAPCALVAYDTGESTLEMLITPTDGEAPAPYQGSIHGGSQYGGLIHVDLQSGWVRRATLEEHMIAEATDSIEGSPSTDYTVRHIDLRPLT
jgi:hypothetical protein